MNVLDKELQYYSCSFPIEDPSIIQHLGYSVKKAIRALNDPEIETILLDYPVVYVHSWEADGKLNLYVGETIDLVRRTDEHKQASEEDKKWQEKWINGQERVSYYFGSRQMNKSLCLDLENTLYELLTQISSARSDLKVHNGRCNPQTAYNNSCWKTPLLEKICADLNDAFSLDLKAPVPQNAPQPPQYADKLIPFAMALNRNTTIADIEKKIRTDMTAAEQYYLLNYPVIYMHCWNSAKSKDPLHPDFCVYTGEANDFLQRTGQHQSAMTKGFFYVNGKIAETEDWHEDWENSPQKILLVFGHPQFHKSMTLDIENRLIQYNIIHGYARNGRTNEQKSYHNKDQTYGIFCEIVDWLVKNSGGRFKSIETIKRESTFMASPLMDLTDEQKQSKSDIQDAINQAIGEASEQYATTKHKLLIVYGSAGTGKTVLASSLFFNLLENKQLNSYFLVNHKELFNAYSTQFDAWKLSRSESKTNAIYFAPTFVNSREKESLNPDVLLVDEAHLLKENGLGGRRMEKPDLASVISSAKVTVLMFDPKQFVDKSKQWAANWQIEDSNSDDEKKNLIATAFQSYVKKHEIDGVDISVYLLKQQMRMQNCTDDTMRWISKLWTENSSIEPPICNQVKCDEERKAWFFTDTKGYEIRIFATMEGLKNAIVEKKKTDNPSSLLATFSWPYKNKDGKPAYIDEALDLKWHYTGKGAAQQDKNVKEKAATNQIWTLSDHVDVGSYHNIQGFDLNYAGVIIGDVFTYSNGKITIDTTKRPMNKTVKRESDVNKTKELISNELKVLLTRGIKGLYIYATNTALRTALWNAVNAAASQSSSQSSRQAEANKGTANNTAEVR